jgi:N-acetylneuraminic acid mutarotase
MKRDLYTPTVVLLCTSLFLLAGSAAGAQEPPFAADWVLPAPMLPNNVHWPAVVQAEGKVFVIGGEYDNEQGHLTARPYIQIYDPNTNTWSQGPENFNPAYLADAAYWDGRIYVMGGKSGFQQNGCNSDVGCVEDFNQIFF